MSTDSRSTGPSRQVRLRRTIAGGIALLLVVGIFSVIAGQAVGANDAKPVASETIATVAPSTSSEPPARPTPDAEGAPVIVPSFDKAAHSIDDPNSIWLVVNKLRPLNPVDFVPGDLVDVPVAHTWSPQMRAEAAAAVVGLFDAASVEAGLSLASNSAYRSYSAQTRIYAGDDTLTARPGYSEHQTGLTMDIGALSGNCSLRACFADTLEGQWLAENAWQYGFLLRYPADKQAVTGYEFEPWHFRYIGVELSTEMHNIGVTTLEEFFGLPAAPVYP